MNFTTAHSIITLIAGVTGGGVGVFILVQLAKLTGIKIGVLEKEASNVIHYLVIAASVLAAVAQYVIQLHSSVSPLFIGVTGSSIYGISQVVYKYSSLAKSRLSNYQLVKPSSDSTIDTPPAPPVAPTGAEPSF